MTQGCVSEYSHIRAMALAPKKNQTFIISASIRVVHWNLDRNILLDIAFERIPNNANSLSTMYFCQSELGLRPSPSEAILS